MLTSLLCKIIFVSLLCNSQNQKADKLTNLASFVAEGEQWKVLKCPKSPKVGVMSPTFSTGILKLVCTLFFLSDSPTYVRHWASKRPDLTCTPSFDATLKVHNNL